MPTQYQDDTKSIPDKTTRRDFIRQTGLLLCTAALALNGRAMAGPVKKPNVLFILADDMRPDCIGALGNPHIQTPHLDTLVARGMAFNCAYVLGANSGAVCLPSRTMLLTGLSAFHFAKGGFAKSDREYTPWAHAMQAGGYETFHLGKKGNSFVPGMEAFQTCLYTNANQAARAESSQEMSAGVIQFLKERQPDKPFFAYIAPPVPHDPRVAPKEFMDRYDPATIPLPSRYQPVHPFDNGEMTVRDEKLAPWPRTPGTIKRHLADAYACITCMDHHIGLILDTLRESGQLDNTIVIFAGDNGLSLGDHGLMGKQNLYEYGGMHVPLVMAGPGIPHGRTDAFVYLSDLYPTTCALTGTPIPPQVESHSLAPLLNGKTTDIYDCLFTAYRTCQRAVRDKRWKMIRYPLVDVTQLFDLQNDPDEMDNLAGKPEYAQKVKEMMTLLAAQQKHYDDPVPLTVATPKDSAWSAPKAAKAAKPNARQ